MDQRQLLIDGQTYDVECLMQQPAPDDHIYLLVVSQRMDASTIRFFIGPQNAMQEQALKEKGYQRDGGSISMTTIDEGMLECPSTRCWIKANWVPWNPPKLILPIVRTGEKSLDGFRLITL